MMFASTADGEPLTLLWLCTNRRIRFFLLAVWVASAVYVFPFRLRGWIPTDEGVFAHAAERVLDGEMPHRDFPEVYTGVG